MNPQPATSNNQLKRAGEESRLSMGDAPKRPRCSGYLGPSPAARQAEETYSFLRYDAGTSPHQRQAPATLQPTTVLPPATHGYPSTQYLPPTSGPHTQQFGPPTSGQPFPHQTTPFALPQNPLHQFTRPSTAYGVPQHQAPAPGYPQYPSAGHLRPSPILPSSPAHPVNLAPAPFESQWAPAGRPNPFLTASNAYARPVSLAPQGPSHTQATGPARTAHWVSNIASPDRPVSPSRSDSSHPIPDNSPARQQYQVVQPDGPMTTMDEMDAEIEAVKRDAHRVAWDMYNTLVRLRQERADQRMRGGHA